MFNEFALISSNNTFVRCIVFDRNFYYNLNEVQEFSPFKNTFQELIRYLDEIQNCAIEQQNEIKRES